MNEPTTTIPRLETQNTLEQVLDALIQSQKHVLAAMQQRDQEWLAVVQRVNTLLQAHAESINTLREQVTLLASRPAGPVN